MSSNLAPPIWRRLFGTRGRNLTSASYILLQRRPRFLMAWNIFKHCSGLRVLGSLIILLVAAIVCVSHYAVIIIVCGPRLFRGGSEGLLTSFIVIIFHLLLIMVIWCYSMVVLTDPGSVPQNWRPMVDEEDAEVQVPPTSSSLPPEINAITFSESLVGGMGQIPGLRYCNKCHNYKPPRCHHCSVCQRCILKMDHHCVWVVNCVGAHNYKFFLLFLLYAFLVTTLDTFVLLPHFIDFFKDVGKHSGSPSNLAVTFLAFILNVAFALSLLGFLIMHASLLSTNTTTVEVYEKKNSTKWRYDLGRRKNFEQVGPPFIVRLFSSSVDLLVFGTRMLYWFIPLYAEEDIASMPVLRGLDFPVRPDLDG